MMEITIILDENIDKIVKNTLKIDSSSIINQIINYVKNMTISIEIKNNPSEYNMK